MTNVLQRLRRSITARLLLVFLGTSALLVILLAIIIAHGFASQWRVNARPHLEQYLEYVSEDIGNPPSIDQARELAQRLSVNIYIVGPDASFSTNGLVLSVDETSFDRPRRHELRRKSFSEANIEFSGDEDRTLLRSVIGDYKVYYELPHRNDATQKRGIIIPALLSVLGVLSICFLIIKRMLRPVRDIRDGVKLMGQGDLSHRVPVRQKNDLGELADSINAMASDIEQMLDAKRQLLLGASHELRSPLTRAKVAVQLLDDSKAQQLIEDDLVEMENLISGILESERMKSGHAVLNRGLINLNDLIQAVVDETQSNNVVVHAFEELPLANVDEIRIRILLRNLIGNAITHTAITDVPIRVTTTIVDNVIRVSVIDSGPGIDPKHLEHLTEPFYRTDASRARATGGFGLGLHLAKLIAQAHGGSLHITSRTASSASTGQSNGTTVIVVLPINSL